MFELEILFANIVVPTLIVGIGAFYWGWTVRANRQTVKDLSSDAREAQESPAEDAARAEDSESAPSWASETTWLAMLCAAIVVAFGLRNGFGYWNEESWLRIPEATCLVALVGAASGRTPWTARWLLRMASIIGAAIMVFPTGEAWEFLLPERTTWIAIISVCSLIAWCLGDQHHRKIPGVLCLAFIPLLAASAMLMAQSFLGVTEPMLAVSSVLGCVALVGLWAKIRWLADRAMGPSLFCSAACISNAQFNSYLGLTNWISFLAVAAPALVAGVSLPFVSNSSAGKKWIGVVVTLGLAFCLAAGLVIWTMSLTAGGGEEDW